MTTVKPAKPAPSIELLTDIVEEQRYRLNDVVKLINRLERNAESELGRSLASIAELKNELRNMGNCIIALNNSLEPQAKPDPSIPAGQTIGEILEAEAWGKLKTTLENRISDHLTPYDAALLRGQMVTLERNYHGTQAPKEADLVEGEPQLHYGITKEEAFAIISARAEQAAANASLPTPSWTRNEFRNHSFGASVGV